ncbi:sulfatase-like hydrolase/transferase [Maribacter sp. CXY002]|uniref:sulfatase-like hydrolase/transferase n=1 Tax=Maribacter luteocoastalis TaxID=3407671 RepID=UPI003B67F1FA
MQIEENIAIRQSAKKLKDFIPMVLSFFAGLIVLSFYQNISLYYYGVLDTVLNSSFLLQLLHHLGYVSVCALVLAFIFNFLENKKPTLGFKTIKVIIFLLLGLESSLITFYLQNFEPLGANLFGLTNHDNFNFSLSKALVIAAFAVWTCHFSYTYIASFYKVISRMYPFTIILFSLFLATLYSEKKPVNENKTQHLVERVCAHWFSSNTYKGEKAYPLLKTPLTNSGLTNYFNLKDERPNIKILIIEGLGSDFAEPNGMYSVFMPNLKLLQENSLYWSNFLSNTGESYATLPTILGSLPFGENGFTNLENFTSRNTLYSILGANGYATSFNYGGNSALNYLDRFLEEENVTSILDKKVFGEGYSLQKEDRAGITLGYADKDLFRRYHETESSSETPKLDVFLTQSTKAPYHIPNLETYMEKAKKVIAKTNFDSKTRRIINNNIELFSSFMYVDEAISEFLREEQQKPYFSNTIYVITGSHNSEVLPHLNALNRYEVPLFIFSPLLTERKEVKNFASHADIAPTLITMLNEKYRLQTPKEVAWLGYDLIETSLSTKKNIPLLRSSYNVQDYISGDIFISDGNTFLLDNNMKMNDLDDAKKEILVKNEFENFKAINRYTTKNNKIVPKSISLVSNPNPEFSKVDLIWLESVFNGKDFDQAYTTAKMLAINKKWNRSILLCDFILSNIPRHPDTEILKGRVFAWQEKYATSTKLLQNVIKKYPNYEDGYCALMDTYYWSGQNDKVYEIQKLAKLNNVSQSLLSEKIKRSLLLVQNNNNINQYQEDSTDQITLQN